LITFPSSEDASKFRNELPSKFGYLHSNQITIGGIKAIYTLSKLGITNHPYTNWKPKFVNRRYLITDKQILNDASKFTTRGEWKTKGKFYQLAHKCRPHLLEKCHSHMRPPIEITKDYQVYAYEFADKTAYVGLTGNPEVRHANHLKYGYVAEQIKKGVSYQFKVIADKLAPNLAAELEIKSISDYKLSWSVFNRHPGGGFGTVRAKYSYKQIFETAKNYKSKILFHRAHHGMSQSVRNRPFLWKRLCQELNWPKHAGHRWTYETCLKEAQKFEWVVDWVSSSPSYNAASKHGWVNRIKKEVGFVYKKQISKWTFEACLAEARKFNNPSNWQYKSGNGSYSSARRKSWLKQINLEAYNRNVDIRWNKVSEDELKAMASKFSTRQQLKFKDSKLYQYLMKSRRDLLPGYVRPPKTTCKFHENRVRM
jgi:predicted GIY-YIG superfamily endonuclease